MIRKAFLCTFTLVVLCGSVNSFVPSAPRLLSRIGLRSSLPQKSNLLRRVNLLPLSMQRSGDDSVPPLERLVSVLPYALPLSDAFQWGHYLFDKFPLLAIPFVPLFPVIRQVHYYIHMTIYVLLQHSFMKWLIY